MMAHLLINPAVAASISTTTPQSHKILASHRISIPSRRDVLVGVAFGLSIIGDRSAADAAARRPPPPPPTEKQDPNVSGVLAKVLASKKRKEAMKESMAQLRQKGKLINSPPPPSSPVEAE